MFAHVSLLLLVLQHLVSNTAEQGYGCGCPDGWVYFRDSCYLFADKTEMDWTEAGHYCSMHHRSNLVVIETPEENAFLVDMCTRLIHDPKFFSQSFWTAGSDGDIEGTWEWYTDDSPFTYTNWRPGEPNSSGGNEDCLDLYSPDGFMWNDDHCENQKHAICELRLNDDSSHVIGK